MVEKTKKVLRKIVKKIAAKKAKPRAKPRLRRIWPLITLIVAVVFVISLFMLFFYSESCKTEECFKDAMSTCKRATYLNEMDASSWQYNIKGISRGACFVVVKNIALVGEEKVVSALKGKEMYCYLPKDIAASGIFPEEKIEFCHGYLKEGFQDIIIEQMHLYIVQNLAQINQSVPAPAVPA